jgi:hypothetical protein
LLPKSTGGLHLLNDSGLQDFLLSLNTVHLTVY